LKDGENKSEIKTSQRSQLFDEQRTNYKYKIYNNLSSKKHGTKKTRIFYTISLLFPFQEGQTEGQY
jgi:hypothetical protein